MVRGVDGDIDDIRGDIDAINDMNIIYIYIHDINDIVWHKQLCENDTLRYKSWDIADVNSPHDW